MYLVLVIIAGALGTLVAVGYVIRARRSGATAMPCLESLCGLLDLDPAERIQRLESWLSEPNRQGRERAMGLILQGCAWLDRGRPARAARTFQVAYHAGPVYESALLLAFACMKVCDGTAEGLLEKSIETWHEVGRPVLGASRWERGLLEACRRGGRIEGGSPLAVALWSLPSEALRQQVLDALSDRPAWAQPLWDPRTD